MLCRSCPPAAWLAPVAGDSHHPGHGRCLRNGSARQLVGGNCDSCRDTVGFSHLLPLPWCNFLRSFSLQPMFAEKAGEKTMENEKIWTKVILTKEKRTPEMAAYRRCLESNTHEALAGRGGEERRPRRSKCPDRGSHPGIWFIQMHPSASLPP